MKKWLLLIIILLIAIWIAFISVSISKEFINLPQNSVNKTTKENPDLTKENPEKTQTPNQENTNNKINSNECYQKQISYSIKNFKEKINKSKINCSLELKNLDEEISGKFEIKFILLPNTTSIISTNLLPKQSKIIYHAFNLTTENPKCNYKTITIPKKQIC